MGIDKDKAARSVVRVIDFTGRGMGLGVFVEPTLVVTTSHSLPREGGRITLPNPEAGPTEMLPVIIGGLAAKSRAHTVVASVDPCIDVACLSDRTWRGAALPDSGLLKFTQFAKEHEPAKLRPAAIPSTKKPKPIKAHLLTQDGTWLEGSLDGSALTLTTPPEGQANGTASGPVFDDKGQLVGLVTFGGVGAQGGTVAVLTQVLPAWVLSRVRKSAKTAK
jgi:hypothetical protein